MIPQQRRRGQRHRAYGLYGQENRSILLEDFLKGRYPNLELNEIIRHVCAFACDREGSKFIQLKLDEATEQHKFFIFAEMQPHLSTLMTDRFANYIVQKFIEIGNDQQRQWILAVVELHLMILGSHKYGCRVVQRAIEYVVTNYNEEHTLLRQFYGPNIVVLAQDGHGNHVIQFLFRSVLDPIQASLYIHLHAHVMMLSDHLHGCRVVQCILEHGSDLIRINVFNQIEPNLLSVIQHRCGNYVIQSAVQFCPPLQQNHLIDFVLVDVIFLSSHKYSSNVVEKCIGLATTLQREQAMNLICSHEPKWLKRFCTGQFSNYVVQKLIEVVGISQVHLLYTKLEPHFNTMARHVCGRNIIDSLQGRLHELDGAMAMYFGQLGLAE